MDNQPNQITSLTFQIPSNLRIKENARKVLALRFEHPEYTHRHIGELVGLSPGRVSIILNNPRILAAMPLLARQRLSNMVPKAIKAYEELVDQKINLQVREKAAGRVLSEKKVFDAPTIKVEGELTLKHVSALKDIVEKAHQVGLSDVVDAELVDDSNPDTTQPTIQ